MDIGLGIKVVWPLAAQEVAAGGAAELEPGHFFCGELKLAGMPVSVLNDIMPDNELVPVLEAEHRQLCAALEDQGIRVPANSTPLRRGLRRQESPEARLEEALRLSATTKSTVLFFDNFHRYLTPSIAGEGMARWFQTLLNDAKTSVMGMTQKQHEHTASWRDVFKPMWIHDAKPTFQP